MGFGHDAGEGLCQHEETQPKQHSGDPAEDQHGLPAAVGGKTQLVEQVAPGADAVSDGLRVGHDGHEELRHVEAEIIVAAQKHQGSQHNEEAFVFDVGGHQRHKPAQHAGQHRDKQRHRGQQQDVKHHGRGGGRSENPAVDHGRDPDAAAVQQAHAKNQRDSCQQNLSGRDGHGKQQFVVLGDVQGGKGIEYAAEGAQQNGNNTHQRVKQPPERRIQQIPQQEGQPEEHAAQKNHDACKQGIHPDDARLAPGLAGFGHDIVAAKALQELFFYQRPGHVMPPVPGRRTPGWCPPSLPPWCRSGSACRP